MTIEMQKPQLGEIAGASGNNKTKESFMDKLIVTQTVRKTTVSVATHHKWEAI